MSSKLVITSYRDGVVSILYNEEQKPLEVHYTGEVNGSKAGNIYIGRVKDVVRQINGAFLDLGDGLKGYYPLSDKAEPFYTRKGNSSNLQQGDELLVQIKKDAVKTKDPAVTSEISVSSVYFVGFLNQPGIHFSGKMKPEEKERIRVLLSDSDLRSFGLIVRTNAAEASETDLKDDLERILNRLTRIKETAPYRPGASCIYKSPADYLNLIKDTRQDLLSEIITDREDLYQEIQTYLTENLVQASDKLRFYQDRLLSLSNLYCVDSCMQEAFQERIWMKSGAYLVIQETEALTVVDVNSGKFTAKKNREEAFLKINIEAAKETARQLRLRNLSGIIIVDFINMDSEENRQLLVNEFQRYLNQDPVKASVIDITPLGLVEVTRQRKQGTIREQMRGNTEHRT